MPGRNCPDGYPPRVRVPKPKTSKAETQRPADSHDLTDIQEHYSKFEKSKAGILVHVSSQHSILDVLYGGDTGRPMPSWTYQTTPEVAVSDQQHTGRCWIFATLAVLGHVFRSQYGISNSRATFSEGYLGFWDLYEKSRLFLHVAYDTRCTPLDDPSLCDLLKGGISDGGDYIFCLNLLDKYGIVPTEYYPNSSYGSMSTEALVTLVNQILRDNAITLRNTGDETLIGPMLTNIFSLLCLGLGTPPAPWKKLDWQIDQCEVMAQFAAELSAPSPPPVHHNTAELPREIRPFRPSVVPALRAAVASQQQSPVYSVSVPPPPPVISTQPSPPPVISPSSSLAGDLLAAASVGAEESTPPSPTPSSTATAAPMPLDNIEEDYEAEKLPPIRESSATVIEDNNVGGEVVNSEPTLIGTRPAREVVDIVTDDKPPCIRGTSACPREGVFQRIAGALSPRRGCPNAVPQVGSGEFVRDMTLPSDGRLLGGCVATEGACRLSHTMPTPPNVEDALSFDYTPREFYYRFLNSIRFVPLVCDMRFPSGTRIISNDANMYGGLPSLYLNVTIDDIEEYAVASLKRNIPIWFACDVKKQLTPEGGRMCNHVDRLSELLPEPHEQGTKLQEIQHFNAVANHALLISAVSLKGKKPVAWRIVNSWGDVGRNGGVFVACGEWFREHVYAINAIYDTLSKQHKEDIDFRVSRPTVRLGPFDPSVI